MNKWDEIRRGCGLEELPPEVTNDLACCMCGPEFKNRRLYTAFKPDLSPHAYKRSIERIRSHVYCKTHAILTYGEDL